MGILFQRIISILVKNIVMSITKQLLSVFAITFFSLENKLYAQTNFVFEDVLHTIKLVKPLSDSNYTFNFEYLSEKQVVNFGEHLTGIKTYLYPTSNNAMHFFYDSDEKQPIESTIIKEKLVIRDDSVDTETIDEMGNWYVVKMAGMVDSTWFFESVQGIEFKEDWSFDLEKFTCEIKTKLFLPLVLMRGKEDYGARGLFYIKPSSNPQNFKPITDFIITDVYIKQDPMTENQLTIAGANVVIDNYKMVMFMNAALDKIKAGKLKCFVPGVPFTKQLSSSEIKQALQEEFVVGQKERFPVRYKMFSYRFQLIEKWFYDPNTMAFKKEALGIVLMKRNEVKDLTTNADGYLSYTFTPVAYVPFNVSDKK